MLHNRLREDESTPVDRKRHIAFVVANDDTRHPDGKRLQRMQLRLPELDDDIKDEHLMWYTPGQLDAYSGGSDVGSHGPIPPVGSRVYVSYEDDSRYHGQYHGGVAHTDNQIAEFTGQSSGGENEGTDLKQPQGYDFAKNYPMSYGNVNSSGDFHGHDAKTDYTEHTAVSGTGWSRDGRGNLSFVVNGNAMRDGEGGNQDAAAKLPEGFSAAIFGQGTVYLSKGMALSIIGDATIQCAGNSTVSARGNANVVANGDVTVSAKQNAEIVAGQMAKVSAKTKIVLAAPTIELATTKVLGPIPTGSSSAGPSSPQDAPDVTARDLPKTRKRPASKAPQNATSY